MGRFTGRRAVVAGGSRRTGRTIALRLADEGADVAVVARGPADLERVAGEIRARGVRAAAIAADVSKPEEVARAARAIGESFGAVDFLVNAAGIYLPGEFRGYPLESWEKTIGVYLTGPFLLTQALLPLLEAPPGGHVVNISSTIIEQGLAGFEAYCAAKSGLVGFSRALALSLRPRGVKVSVVTPHAINATGDSPDDSARLETSDVADAILYLLGLPPRVHIFDLTLRTSGNPRKS